MCPNTHAQARGIFQVIAIQTDGYCRQYHDKDQSDKSITIRQSLYASHYDSRSLQVLRCHDVVSAEILQMKTVLNAIMRPLPSRNLKRLAHLLPNAEIR